MVTPTDLVRRLYYQLPDSLRRAELVRRRTPIWERAGIVFIHIPKAAGTSINHALYGRFMGHVRASDVRRWGSSALNALPSFAVTRNPWDRLVSAYRFARRLHAQDWKDHPNVPLSIRRQVPRFGSFNALVDWLDERDITKLNQIFQPQSLFVCNAHGDVIVDHLGKIEDLEPTFDFLREHLGTVPTIGQENRSGDAVDFRTFYTRELIERAAQIYSDDIVRFGYAFPQS